MVKTLKEQMSVGHDGQGEIVYEEVEVKPLKKKKRRQKRWKRVRRALRVIDEWHAMPEVRTQDSVGEPVRSEVDAILRLSVIEAILRGEK